MQEPDLVANPVRNRELESFLARAEDARAQAEVATLVNVRDRCLRAEAAWREMAARAQRTETLRATSLAVREAGVVPT